MILRRCVVCKRHRIPYGVDWPSWKDGRPVCIECSFTSDTIFRDVAIHEPPEHKVIAWRGAA